MAEAVHQKAVTRTEIVEVEPEKFVLTLSRPEAEALSVVLGQIGGLPERSARGLTMRISDALQRVGLYSYNLGQYPEYAFDGDEGEVNTIYFANRG